MLAILALCLAVGAAAPPVDVPSAVSVVPGSAEAVVLDDRPSRQAVVADLDGDGSRELIRLSIGQDAAVLLDAWTHVAGAWAPFGGEIELVPPRPDRFDVALDAAPARVIVRRIGEAERVTLVRQPRFEPPGLEPNCCLQLHDVELDGSRLVLRLVGSAREAVDALLALDLDGDGTDELLASRSLPPLGRTAYPSEALVYRWSGDRFASPTLTELSIGSGDTPFVLGETDGRPGEEAAIIGRAAQSRLYRLVLEADDRITAETSGIIASAVAALTVDGRPGVAVIGPVNGLTVHRWPAGEALAPALGQRAVEAGRLIGAVDSGTGSLLFLERSVDAPLEALTVPDLALSTAAIASRPAIEAIQRTTILPYRGILPGGGPDGAAALIHDGVLTVAGVEPRLVPAFGGARPVGLLGPGGQWLAVHHAPGPSTFEPTGGRLEPVGAPASGPVALVPVADAMRPEVDDGVFAPRFVDAAVLDEQDTLGIAASGFGVLVEAPAGSRVHAGLGTGSAALGVQSVPEDGRLDLRLPLPRSVLPYSGDTAWVAVVSPSGGTYVASWNVLALTGPPPIEATTSTALGSPAVEVRGTTVPYAEVRVGGRPVRVAADGSFVANVDMPPWPTEVEIEAIDPLGNVARVSATGIGLLDWRALPWTPITAVLLVAAAAVLFVRQPRAPAPIPARADDAVLEDVDPES